MPFFREKQRNVLFVHIPKCGGTTVERALTAQGIELSFFDPQFGLHDYEPWCRSSPQHLTREDRDRLFAHEFFDYEFGLVREPVARFLSAFNHQRRRIGVFVSFERFLDQIEARNRQYGDFFGYRYDNHFLPAARFCSEMTKVFALEDGIDACLKTVSEEIGRPISAVPSQNIKEYRFTDSDHWGRRAIKKAFAKDSPKIADLSEDSVRRIKALYAEDYERFECYTASHIS